MRRIIGVCACAIFFAGCTAVPKVQYTKITNPKDVVGDEIDTFSFWESQILIEKTEPKKDAAGKAIVDFSILSKPRELAEYKIGVRRADSWGVKTNLNIVKLPNTSLIQEIGVDVTDSRADLIGKYGATAVKLIGLVPLGSGDLEDSSLPKTINLQAVFKAEKNGREAKNGLDAADGVSIDLGAVPVDAIEASAYAFPTTLEGIMYPACRSAVVRFKYKGHDFKKSVAIADPRYLSYVGFPISGKVTFHSECGVSTVASKDASTTSSAAIVDALVAQGKAVKDALDAANKSK
jgi:hypothetical protein